MKLTELRVSAPTALVLAAITGAAAFAAARGGLDTSREARRDTGVEAPAAAPDERLDELPEGQAHAGDMAAAAQAESTALPPGHPPLERQGAAVVDPSAPVANLTWTAPPRWQKVPNPSTMRMATYRIPHADGDSEDPELSVSRAGGSIEANAQRWIDQFDAEGRKAAKRSKRTVGKLEVTMVEVAGTFSGGMSRERGELANFMLVGAIVATEGMPHFFKLTGPKKSVLAARAELDALVGSLAVE